MDISASERPQGSFLDVQSGALEEFARKHLSIRHILTRFKTLLKT